MYLFYSNNHERKIKFSKCRNAKYVLLVHKEKIKSSGFTLLLNSRCSSKEIKEAIWIYDYWKAKNTSNWEWAQWRNWEREGPWQRTQATDSEHSGVTRSERVRGKEHKQLRVSTVA
jgi:hypothetical protein